MISHTLLPRWASPILFSCLAVVTACGSSDASSEGTAGSTSAPGAAGAASGGSSNAGAAGSGVAGAASAGGGAGGTTGGLPGTAGAGASSGGASGGTGGAATAGAGGAGGAAAGAGGASGGAGGSAGSGAFALTSPSWTSQADCSATAKTGCGVFPKESIGTNIGGSNKSPELTWGAGPTGTQSYAIAMRDLTFLMGGKPFVHWVMWNIPGATRSLPAGLETAAMPSVPAGSSQRSFQGSGFQGSGACGNVYEFTLYALPMATFTPTGTTQTAVADGLAATNAPTATLRARSGAPGCTE